MKHDYELRASIYLVVSGSYSILNNLPSCLGDLRIAAFPSTAAHGCNIYYSAKDSKRLAGPGASMVPFLLVLIVNFQDDQAVSVAIYFHFAIRQEK